MPGEHGKQAGAKRHFRLAEADIAADQPVHRLAAGEIVEHGVDAGLLVLGFLVGKARREFVVDAVGRGQHRGLMQRAHGGDLDQLLGDVADALLQSGFARLPGHAAKLVELNAGFVGAIAAQELDVLDRQIELVAALIDQLQAVMRLAVSLDGGKADETADAVIGMDDEIALGQA